MRFTLSLLLGVLAMVPISPAQAQQYERGTVTKMRMTECFSSHKVLAALGGSMTAPTPGICPEYTLVGSKVVYVVLGKRVDQLIPLAEEIIFRIHKNEISVRIDDERHEARFSVSQMMLRPDWEREELRREKQNEAREGNKLRGRQELGRDQDSMAAALPARR